MLAHKLKDREWGQLYIIGMAVMNHCEARTLNFNERVGYSFTYCSLTYSSSLDELTAWISAIISLTNLRLH